MGSGFENHVSYPRIYHFPEGALQVHGFWCGYRRRLDIARIANIHRAYHPHLQAASSENGLQQVSCGGLAVGSGDADNRKAVGGETVEAVGKFGQSYPGIGNLKDSRPRHGVQWFLHHQNLTASVNSLGDEIMTVASSSFDRYKEAALRGLAAVVSNGPDLTFQVAVQSKNAKILNQVLQQQCLLPILQSR